MQPCGIWSASDPAHEIGTTCLHGWQAGTPPEERRTRRTISTVASGRSAPDDDQMALQRLMHQRQQLSNSEYSLVFPPVFHPIFVGPRPHRPARRLWL